MGLKLKAPILSANMDTITEFRMALAMNTAGGLGILHRYAKPLTVCEWIGALNRRGAVAVPSIGVQPEDIATLELYIGAGAKHVCIDIAHGDCLAMVEMIKYIKSKYSIKIMAGNVATRWGARRLFKAGADVVKVGVGGGCFLPEMLIQTPTGLEPIKSIQIGQLVKTHLGTFEVVTDTDSHTHKGEVVSIKTKIGTIDCTPEHEIYVLDKKNLETVTDENIHLLAQWIKAKDLSDRFLMIAPGPTPILT
jgi:hypothetical protein